MTHYHGGGVNIVGLLILGLLGIGAIAGLVLLIWGISKGRRALAMTLAGVTILLLDLAGWGGIAFLVHMRSAMQRDLDAQWERYRQEAVDAPVPAVFLEDQEPTTAPEFRLEVVEQPATTAPEGS